MAFTSKKKTAESGDETVTDEAAVETSADSETEAPVERESAGRGPAIGTPEWRRADNVRALEEELDMCERDGKTERVAAIKAAIKAAKSGPAGRKAPESDEA